MSGGSESHGEDAAAPKGCPHHRGHRGEVPGVQVRGEASRRRHAARPRRASWAGSSRSAACSQVSVLSPAPPPPVISTGAGWQGRQEQPPSLVALADFQVALRAPWGVAEPQSCPASAHRARHRRVTLVERQLEEHILGQLPRVQRGTATGRVASLTIHSWPAPCPPAPVEQGAPASFNSGPRLPLLPVHPSEVPAETPLPPGSSPR